MLGRKNYTQAEYDHAKKAVDQQLAAYKKLVKAVDTADPKVKAALEGFEPLFLNNMTMVLDRYFVHRIRPVTGKDGNPLNEVELMTESLLDDGVFRANKVIKLHPDESVAKIKFGDKIAMNVAQFERLAKAFFAEVEARFL
jgi:Cu/Ag efflux protein CusF